MGKKILLMYISEKSGHHRASLAIEEALRKLDHDVEILNINAFNYTNPLLEKIINGIYMKIIKNRPEIWDYIYDNPKFEKRTKKLKNLIHKYNSIKLKVLLEDFKPDLIACTQAFPCGMIADYKKFFNAQTPLFAILTDFNAHMYWIYDNVDVYCVASLQAKERLKRSGIDERKIKILGIPISQEFNKDVDKNDALKKFNLNSGLPKVLVMGGGSGVGPIKETIHFLDRAKSNFQILAICGINQKLFRQLKNLENKMKKDLFVFEYLDSLNEIMGISDIIVTKSGGLSSAEALAKGLPIVINRPIPGQEVYNAKFLLQTNAAILARQINEVPAIVDKILTEKDRLSQMSIAAKNSSHPNASIDIAKLLLNFIN